MIGSYEEPRLQHRDIQSADPVENPDRQRRVVPTMFGVDLMTDSLGHDFGACSLYYDPFKNVSLLLKSLGLRLVDSFHEMWSIPFQQNSKNMLGRE